AFPQGRHGAGLFELLKLPPRHAAHFHQLCGRKNPILVLLNLRNLVFHVLVLHVRVPHGASMEGVPILGASWRLPVRGSEGYLRGSEGYPSGRGDFGEYPHPWGTRGVPCPSTQSLVSRRMAYLSWRTSS